MNREDEKNRIEKCLDFVVKGKRARRLFPEIVCSLCESSVVDAERSLWNGVLPTHQ